MYVITGGAGFIGSNIAAALENKGSTPLVICDRLRNKSKWLNIAKRNLYNIVFPEQLTEFLSTYEEDITGIIHMGAISTTTETDADKIVANNFHLSRQLWQWCTEHQVVFIYASSAATYGGGENGFKTDMSRSSLSRLRPLNPYGWSKHLFDRWVADRVGENSGCPPQWAGLKFFNVYGPNEYHKGNQRSVVHHVFSSIKAGQPATLFKSHHPDYEDGGQRRDFIAVEDCTHMVLWLLDNPHVNGIFNCGTGKARRFDDLVHAVYEAMGLAPQINYVPTPENIRARYQYWTQADMSGFQDLRYELPATSLEKGIGDYVHNYLLKEDPYR